MLPKVSYVLLIFFNARSVTKSLLTFVWFSRFLDEGKNLFPEVNTKSPRRSQGEISPRTSRLSLRALATLWFTPGKC